MTGFSPTPDESRAYFEDRLEVTLPSRDEVAAKCPFHDDRTASMSINFQTGTWFCHACNLGGGLLQFERRLTGKEKAECWAAINKTIGRKPQSSGQGSIVATYEYEDAGGNVIYEALRYEPKAFRQRRPDGKGGHLWNMDGIHRVLFNLPLLVRSNVVLIGEGERDALSLQKAAAQFPDEDGKLIYAATTNIGGAGKWLDEYSSYLIGKKVFIFPDNDDAGRTHAQQVRASVEGYAHAVSVVELPDVPEKGDVSDYLENHSADQLFALMVKASSERTAPSASSAAGPGDDIESGGPLDDSDFDWPEPEKLGEQLPPVPAFDPDLLPASLRPMVEDVTDRMQTPPDFAAVVAVATLAGVCGRRALIQPKERDSSWVVVPNLWGGIVAGPGMMKSPLVAAVTAPARALETEWRAAYSEAMREYEAAQERAKLESAVWAESYKHAVKKQQEPPTRPQLDVAKPSQRRMIAVDATFESLQQLLAENPAGVFVLRDELSGWLASLERQGRESERAFYLETWGGDTGFTIDRVGRGSIHVEHCCVSLFGSIQPARLRPYLADALRDGRSNDGLIQRFQLLIWPDMQGWAYRDRTPNARAMKTADSVYRRIAEMDAETPLRLKFAPEAQALFVAWVSDLEARLRADDVSPFMQAHLAKYRKLMPALALLFALADGSLEAVGLRHAQQAADWTDYLAQHARRIYTRRSYRPSDGALLRHFVEAVRRLRPGGIVICHRRQIP